MIEWMTKEGVDSLDVYVEQIHIDEGVPQSYSDCMVAQAVRQLPFVSSVYVGPMGFDGNASWGVSINKKGKCQRYEFSADVVRKILAWDRGEDVEPFMFTALAVGEPIVVDPNPDGDDDDDDAMDLNPAGVALVATV